jgi:hypothetical protein
MPATSGTARRKSGAAGGKKTDVIKGWSIWALENFG